MSDFDSIIVLAVISLLLAARVLYLQHKTKVMGNVIGGTMMLLRDVVKGKVRLEPQGDGFRVVKLTEDDDDNELSVVAINAKDINNGK